MPGAKLPPKSILIESVALPKKEGLSLGAGFVQPEQLSGVTVNAVVAKPETFKSAPPTDVAAGPT